MNVVDAYEQRIRELKTENEKLKELAKKNNDWNIVTANLAQRKTIDNLKQQLLDKTSSEEGFRKAIEDFLKYTGSPNSQSNATRRQLLKLKKALEGAGKEGE